MNFCTHIKNQEKMLSTTDFEKLLFFYKAQGRNMSIRTFSEIMRKLPCL
jgi:hypothetical protein